MAEIGRVCRNQVFVVARSQASVVFGGVFGRVSTRSPHLDPPQLMSENDIKRRS